MLNFQRQYLKSCNERACDKQMHAVQWKLRGKDKRPGITLVQFHKGESTSVWDAHCYVLRLVNDYEDEANLLCFLSFLIFL